MLAPAVTGTPTDSARPTTRRSVAALRVTAALAAAVAASALSIPVGAVPLPTGGATATGAGTAAGARTSVTAPTAADTPSPAGRLAIGDSLSVSIAPLLTAQQFSVHAKVGRQFSTAPGIVRSYGAALPRNVVIELGTNGTVRMADCRAIVRAAGPERVVFLVTNRVPRPWQAGNNRTLHACNRAYRTDRVRIVNWYRASAGHPEWFVNDRVHLTAAGRRALAAQIDRRVDRYGR